MPVKEIAKAAAGALPVVGDVVGGIIDYKSQGKALDAQQRATAEALAFQREQAAKEDAYRQQQWEQWNAGRNALLSRYGISLPMASAAPQGAVPRQAAPVQQKAAQIAQAASQTPSGQTIEQILSRRGGDPFSWQGYGLG